MNKLIGGVVAIFIAFVAVVFAVTRNNKNILNPNYINVQKNGSSSPSKSTRKACDLLTLDNAKQILGSTAEIGSSSGVGDTATTDIAITTCSYENKNATASNITISTIFVRDGLSEVGELSNQSGFDSDKLKYNITTVSNIGDTAYYNNDLGQLDILKGNYWLIITSGGVGVNSHSQTQAAQIAQLALQKI